MSLVRSAAIGRRRTSLGGGLLSPASSVLVGNFGLVIQIPRKGSGTRLGAIFGRARQGGIPRTRSRPDTTLRPPARNSHRPPAPWRPGSRARQRRVGSWLGTAHKLKMLQQGGPWSPAVVVGHPLPALIVGGFWPGRGPQRRAGRRSAESLRFGRHGEDLSLGSARSAHQERSLPQATKRRCARAEENPANRWANVRCTVAVQSTELPIYPFMQPVPTVGIAFLPGSKGETPGPSVVVAMMSYSRVRGLLSEAAEDNGDDRGNVVVGEAR